MAIVKRITDLGAYTSVLPYASELFGVYQPLLGWKSKRIAKRFEEGFLNDKPQILDKLMRRFADLVEIEHREGGRVDIQIRPGVLRGGKPRPFDSIVLQRVATRLPPYEEYTPSVWADAITTARLDAILKKDVVELYSKAYQELRRAGDPRLATLGRRHAPAGADDKAREVGAFEHQVRYESSVAGALLFLQKEHAHRALEEIFYTSKDSLEQARTLLKMLETEDGGQPPKGLPQPEDVGFSGIFSDALGGQFQLLQGEFESGRTYLFSCFISDRAGGPPHAIAYDMYEAVTIE